MTDKSKTPKMTT